MIQASPLPDHAQQTITGNLGEWREDCAQAFDVIVEQPIVEWIESNLRFGPGDKGYQLESRSGPLTFADSPWWRYILECSVDPRVESVAVPAATQTHKTTSLLIAVPLWLAEFRPGPGMIVVPDELEAKKIRDRIYGVVEESRKFVDFERIRIPPEHERNLQEINLGSMIIHLAWAGSRQRTRGKPCFYVWFTECDVYRDSDKKAGDPVEAGKQRTKDVFRFKHFFESSPSEEPSTICDEEALADKRWRWHITCPHCGRKQEPRFFKHKRGDYIDKGGFELTVKAVGTDGGSLMGPAQARKHAHYICLNGCKITNDHKQHVVEGGEWLPEGWTEGDEVDYTPARSVGFHLWALHSPNETFGVTAQDYLNHVKKGKAADFWGNRLARPFRPQTRVPKWTELGREHAWTNARRTVPDRAWFLTAGVDKQGENNGARYVIRGWGPGRTSWLVDWGWIARDPEDTGPVLSDLLEVERLVLNGSFPVVNRDNEPSTDPFLRSRQGVKLTNIDTNHLPMQIHRWMRTLPENWVDRMNGDRLIPGRIRNIRGDHTVRPDVRFRHSLVETNTRSGEKYEGGLHLWGLSVYPYYSELTDFLGGEVGQIGSWYVTADALAQGREYLEQVCNFHYAVTIDPRKGKKGAWVPRSGRIPVDFWDCEIYAMAAAEMVVGSLGWELEAWEAWRETQLARKQQPPRRPRVQQDEIGAR